MLKRLLIGVSCFFVGLLPGLTRLGSGFAAESPESLQAGAYAQDITPRKFPISVNGNMSDMQATGAHDPLHARCLVLKNSETSLAIVVCDSCAIPRELMERAKAAAAERTGIPKTNILISATHSHSCPTLTAVFQSEPNREYVDFLVEQIATGIERANNQAEPARVGWGSVQQKALLFNRRWRVATEENVENPFGAKADRIITNPGFNNPKVSESINLIDPELSFLSVQSRDGRPIALFANYSLHYIGGVPGPVVSADYFGEFSQRISQHLNASQSQPPFVGAMSNGTSGDVNNVDFQQKTAPRREPFEQIIYAAELLAQDVSKACEKIRYHDTLPIKVREEDILLDVRKPTADELAAADAKLAGAEIPLKGLPLVYARETKLLGEYPTSVKAKVQAIRIGSLGIAGTPCETFTETGLDIKNHSPFKSTFTISLANGYNGYLPPPEQMSKGGYETWRARSSYLASDSEPKVREAIKRLLLEVSQ